MRGDCQPSLRARLTLVSTIPLSSCIGKQKARICFYDYGNNLKLEIKTGVRAESC